MQIGDSILHTAQPARTIPILHSVDVVTSPFHSLSYEKGEESYALGVPERLRWLHY